MKDKESKELKKHQRDYQKHNKLKWLLKDELEMLTINELWKIKKLIISFYDRENCR